MNVTTIVGIVAGLGLTIGAIFAAGGGLVFISIPSVLIVVGGTIGATLINFDLKDVLSVLKVTKKVFSGKVASYNQTVEILVDLAEKARREGILAIERELDVIEDDYLKHGIQYAVDGTEPETIKIIMETELDNLRDRHMLGQNIYITLGTFAPAFGMVGTLIGLIAMLQSLEDPTKIGLGMATALVTTLYGAVLANLFFLPMAGKLNNKSNEEFLQKQLVVEGILAIQSGDNPRLVRERLLTFLSPAIRDELAELGE